MQVLIWLLQIMLALICKENIKLTREAVQYAKEVMERRVSGQVKIALQDKMNQDFQLRYWLRQRLVISENHQKY